MNSLVNHPRQVVTEKTSVLSGGDAAANAAGSAAATQIAGLEAKTGAFTQLAVKRQESKSAGRELVALATAQNQALGRIGKTAIAIAESQTHQALVAAAMPVTAALVMDLAAKTTQVHASLTQFSLAGAQAIVSNRTACRAAIDAMQGRGQITAEERGGLIDQTDADHAADLNRMRATVQEAREVVHSLWQKSTGRIVGSDYTA